MITFSAFNQCNLLVCPGLSNSQIPRRNSDSSSFPNTETPLSGFCCIFQVDFFSGVKTDSERRDCFFVCTACRIAVQEVNWVHPDVQFVRAKASDSVGTFSFPSAR